MFTMLTRKGVHKRIIGKGRTAVEILQERLERLNIKPRKNAVLANEYVLTFSPEMAGRVNINKWVAANLEFMKQEHGREGILTVDLHMDETTPHLQVLVAPLIEKEVRGRMQWRLSATDFWDGRKMLSERQDRYESAMQPFGLVRGLKGSKTPHRTIKSFYGAIEKSKHELSAYMSGDYRQVESNLEAIGSKKPKLIGLPKAFDNLFNQAQAILQLVQDQAKSLVALRNDNKKLTGELTEARKMISEVNQKYMNSDVSELEKSLEQAENTIISLENEQERIIFEANNKITKANNIIAEKDSEISKLTEKNQFLEDRLDHYLDQSGLRY